MTTVAPPALSLPLSITSRSMPWTFPTTEPSLHRSVRLMINIEHYFPMRCDTREQLPKYAWDHTVYKGQGWVAAGENNSWPNTNKKKQQKKGLKKICVCYFLDWSLWKTPRAATRRTLSASLFPSLHSPPLPYTLSPPPMSATNSSAYRSERSFHQTSSSSSSGNPYMEKSRGLFAEDFGSFMRPGSDALGFSSKLEANSGHFVYKSGVKIIAAAGWRGSFDCKVDSCLCLGEICLKCAVFPP